MSDEVKSVNISLVDNRTPKEIWEDEWLTLYKHEPNNRQKRRRMEKDWEKYLSKK